MDHSVKTMSTETIPYYGEGTNLATQSSFDIPTITVRDLVDMSGRVALT
jgi:hypothetical protein